MSDEETYRELFVAESRENHQNIVDSLLVLEEGADDTAINEIFRSAHTLKGMSASMGYEAMERLCHTMEDVFQLIRNDQLEVSQGLIDLLLSATDLIEEMLDDIEAGKQVDPDITAGVVSQLKQLREAGVAGGEEPEASVPVQAIEEEPETGGYAVDSGISLPRYLISVRLDDACIMKDIRAIITLQNLEELGRIIKTAPPRDVLEEGTFEGSTFEITVESDAGEEALSTTVSGPEISDVSVRPVAAAEAPPETSAGTPAVAESKKGSSKVREIKNIRVDLDRLDQMMNLVEDLVINRGRLVQIAEKYQIKEFDEALSMVGRSVSDLQNLMMNIRMIPLSQIFNRLPRVVRDVAHHDGKEVEFIVEGGETELDRSVMDGLSDPLLHIIRNAVNHGIEVPEVRVKAGKPAKGRLRLSARRDKGNVLIEVEDDGGGIDPKKLMKIAVEKGMMTEEEAQATPDEDLINLLFQPGFSTAEKITDISGRGVGLDVVKSVIESLKGSVKVESEVKKGSRFELLLPPTMAIVEVMMVRINGRRCAIPINNVVEVSAARKDDTHHIGSSEAILMRDEVLPLYRLDDMFGKSIKGDTIVVLHFHGKKCCIVVDVVEGQQEVVVKPLSSLVGSCAGVSGITIPGDGDVVPVLDVNSMV